MRARVTGYLTEVKFTDGQDVKAGDLLFTIDPRPFERALDQAKAQLDQAKVSVSNAEPRRRARPAAAEARLHLEEGLRRPREPRARRAKSLVKVARGTRQGRGARAELLPHHGADLRPHQPHAGHARQLRQRRRQRHRHDGPDHHRHAGPDLHLLRRQREQRAEVSAHLAESSGKGTGGMLGAAVGVGLPDEKGFPHTGKLDFLENRLDAGHRHACAPAPSSPTRTASSRPACSRACACRARPSTRRCCCPTRRSAPIRRPASSTSSATTTSPCGARWSSGR